MKRTRWAWALALAAVSPFALAAEPPAPAPPPAAAEEGVIDPRADAQLKRMSQYLTRLKTFRVEATVVDEKVTAQGQKIQELKEQTLSVARPNKLRIDRHGPNGHATLASDGAQVVLVNTDKKLYAKDAAPASLNDLVDALRERLQVEAPGGDFLTANPYQELIDGLKLGHYIGLEPLGDVMAHHIAVTEQDLDWQIWIQDGEKPLPLRYVITSKDMPGEPQFTLELRNWEPSATLAPDTFNVSIPADAQRIEGRRQTSSRLAAPPHGRADPRSTP